MKLKNLLAGLALLGVVSGVMAEDTGIAACISAPPQLTNGNNATFTWKNPYPYGSVDIVQYDCNQNCFLLAIINLDSSKVSNLTSEFGAVSIQAGSDIYNANVGSLVQSPMGMYYARNPVHWEKK